MLDGSLMLHYVKIEFGTYSSVDAARDDLVRYINDITKYENDTVKVISIKEDNGEIVCWYTVD